jgi:MFS family permease
VNLGRLKPTGALWRHGDFMKLWAGQSISEVGTAISQLALPLVAVLILKATAFEVAALGTVEFLPFLLLTLPAGVWVDRLSRRLVLIVGDAGRALLLASIPIAYVADALTLWQLYVVGFLVGVLTVFFDVAYQSYLPSLVEREHLVEGNSKLQVTVSGAQIGGPGIAGALISAISAPYAIVLDAISFVVSGVFTVAIEKREELPERHPDTARPRMRTELREGLGYVLRHKYLLPQAISTGTSNYFSNVLFSIFVVYAVRSLHLSAALIGIAFMGGGIGWLLGSLSANRLGSRLGVGRATILGAAVTGPSSLLVPLAPHGFPLPFLVASGIGTGFGAVVYNIQQVSLRQAITPERMQGRMNAVMRFLVWGTIPLGSLTGGALASWIGLRATLFVGALGGFTSVIPIVFSQIRTLVAIPDQEEPPTALEAAAEGGIVGPVPAHAGADADGL